LKKGKREREKETDEKEEYTIGYKETRQERFP
jgi:hypothetical protein